MTIIQSLVLGIIQGLTEFLPISSSAHLILVPKLLKWPEHSLIFDTSLHLGTTLAVILYFGVYLRFIKKHRRNFQKSAN